MKRIFASDIELSLEVNKNTEKSAWIRNEDTFAKKERLIKSVVKDKVHLNSRGILFNNGGGAYVDIGSHLEACTPECDGIFDAIKYEEATILECAELLRNHPEAEIFLNNLDFDGETFGAHQNFSTSVNQKGRNALLLPCIIEKLWSSSGRFYPCGNFELSQRVGSLVEAIGEGTTQDRAILNTRDENHSGNPPKLYRFHHISNDALRCQGGNLLTRGMMHIFLTLLENNLLPDFGYIGDKQISQLESEKIAVRDIRTLSQQPHSWTIKSMPAERRSALKIAEKYLEVTKTELNKQSLDIDFTIDLCRDTLEKLARYETEPHLLVGRLDWITKKYIVDEFASKQGLRKGSEGISQALEFEKIGRDSLYSWMKENHMIEVYIPDNEIEYARKNPPNHTRANFRGQIAKLRNRLKPNQCLDIIWDWTRARIEYINRDQVVSLSTDTSNPFDTKEKEFEEIEDKLIKEGIIYK